MYETTVTYHMYISDQSYRPKDLQNLAGEFYFNNMKAEIYLPLPKL